MLTPVFLGLPLAVKTRIEDWFSLLRCLSCDQAEKRFTKRQAPRIVDFFFLINQIPASVKMGAFGK